MSISACDLLDVTRAVSHIGVVSPYAVAYFQTAHRLSPDDKDLIRWDGHNAKPVLATLRARLDGHPTDFFLRQTISHGTAAQQRTGDAIPMWDAFIAANPTDPRAWAQRAGAYWLSGRREEGIHNMKRACALGYDKACVDEGRMKAMAGK